MVAVAFRSRQKAVNDGMRPRFKETVQMRASHQTAWRKSSFVPHHRIHEDGAPPAPLVTEIRVERVNRLGT